MGSRASKGAALGVLTADSEDAKDHDYLNEKGLHAVAFDDTAHHSLIGFKVLSEYIWDPYFEGNDEVIAQVETIEVNCLCCWAALPSNK